MDQMDRKRGKAIVNGLGRMGKVGEECELHSNIFNCPRGEGE